MNQKQKTTLRYTGYAILGLMMFPPFEAQIGPGYTSNMGFAFIFTPPETDYSTIATVNNWQLFVQLFGTLALGAIAFFLCGTQNSSGNVLPNEHINYLQTRKTIFIAFLTALKKSRWWFFGATTFILIPALVIDDSYRLATKLIVNTLLAAPVVIAVFTVYFWKEYKGTLEQSNQPLLTLKSAILIISGVGLTWLTFDYLSNDKAKTNQTTLTEPEKSMDLFEEAGIEPPPAPRNLFKEFELKHLEEENSGQNSE